MKKNMPYYSIAGITFTAISDEEASHYELLQ